MTDLALRQHEASGREGAFRAPFLLTWLALATVAVAFAISSYALIRFGINYGDTGGALAAKIHPATYLLAMAVLARIVLQGRPTYFMIAAAARHRGAVAFLWIVTCLLAYVAANLHVPLSSL